MADSDSDATAREVAQRILTRLPSSLTGSERRISNARIDALTAEFYSLHRRIDAVEERLGGRIDVVEQRLSGRIDGLDGKIDQLGTHVIDRLGDLDAKLDRLLETSETGKAGSEQ